ncbi:hypothetical protein F7Q91_05465 [Vibrio chagasii]|uniref:Uncharacterized protein n=1 Tax=Vibrio chagasii TaxID=170679 RepID=A0A7V7NWC4_9VIBR|nr:hypothetical protein F7Q91_05465 [Vibrio chagasii]
MLLHRRTRSSKAPTVKERYDYGFCPRNSGTLRFENVYKARASCVPFVSRISYLVSSLNKEKATKFAFGGFHIFDSVNRN